MNQIPTPRHWASSLLGVALTILFASIAVSWSLMILESIAAPLTLILGLVSVLWLVAVVRRRVRGDDW